MALEQLQSLLVLDPANEEARSIQSRLLLARKKADAESTRLAIIERLLSDASSQFDAGSAEASLSAANYRRRRRGRCSAKRNLTLANAPARYASPTLYTVSEAAQGGSTGWQVSKVASH